MGDPFEGIEGDIIGFSQVPDHLSAPSAPPALPAPSYTLDQHVKIKNEEYQLEKRDPDNLPSAASVSAPLVTMDYGNQGKLKYAKRRTHKKKKEKQKKKNSQKK